MFQKFGNQKCTFESIKNSFPTYEREKHVCIIHHIIYSISNGRQRDERNLVYSQLKISLLRLGSKSLYLLIGRIKKVSLEPWRHILQDKPGCNIPLLGHNFSDFAPYTCRVAGNFIFLLVFGKWLFLLVSTLSNLKLKL